MNELNYNSDSMNNTINMLGDLNTDTTQFQDFINTMVKQNLSKNVICNYWNNML